MSHVYVAIARPADNLDDVRYEHHLRHEGQANHQIFWIFWLMIAAFLALKLATRTYMWWRCRVHRTHRYAPLLQKDKTRYIQRGATFVSAVTSLPSPQIFGITIITASTGRIAILIAYITITITLLVAVDAPIFSNHFLDDIAFRAAWISLTQIPLVYFLSTKRGSVNIFAGLSYERINWVHRWVGRMLFISATTHVVIMKSSISTKDILHSQDPTLSVVRYGIATYSMLIWIAITSILPLRRCSYRLFYMNHYISTLAFLVVAFQHVPTYARPPIYLSATILTLDKLLVGYFFLRNNVSVGPPTRRFARCRRGKQFKLGLPIRMTTPSISVSALTTQTKDTTTIVRISAIPFSWKPGQHIRLTVPALGRFEMHPFTPANCSAIPPPPLPPRKDVEPGLRNEGTRQTSEMLLMVKAKSGFTKRLADYHKEWLARPCPNATEPADETLTAYIDGPYGAAPMWHEYENLVLIASSTGVSFILSILDHLEQLCFSAGPEELRMRNVKIVWMTRHVDPSFEEVVKDIVKRGAMTLRDFGVSVDAEFWSTCPDSKLQEEMAIQFDPFAHLRPPLSRRVSDRPALRIRNPDEIYDEWDREAEEEAKKYYDPFGEGVDACDAYEEESDESDETSTLVDGEEERNSGDHDDWMEREDDPFSDEHVAQQDDAYRPLPSPKRKSQETMKKEPESCRCGIIQHQRRKLKTRHVEPEIIAQRHGFRPDIQRMVHDSIPSLSEEKTMVAVCANRGVTRDVQVVVAQVNMDFAMGRRRGKVDVHIENQG